MQTSLLFPNSADSSELGKQALALMQANDHDGAETSCRQGLANTPADATLATVLAAIQLGRNQVDDALKTLMHHRYFWPESFWGAYNAAAILLAANRPAEARELFRIAVQLFPQSPEAHFMLGQATARLGVSPEIYNEAREHFRIAAEARPDWGEAHYCHGLYCSYSSREVEAEQALRRALALIPNNAEVIYRLASVLLELDRIPEAVELLKRVVEIEPKHEAAIDALAKISSADAKTRAGRLPRYPRSASEYADLRQIIRKYILTEFPNPRPFIGPNTRVFTMGSCFAQNIAIGLQRQGVPAECVNYSDDINSTYANRYFLEWVEGQQNSLTEPYQQFFGAPYRDHIRDLITNAGVAVISLGVAPCFFDRKTGAFVSTVKSNFQVSLRVRDCDFRTTTVAENVENLQTIVRGLRKFNANIQVVITVSPVPLKATFERPSAIVADCISKSTLRVAAHEFQKIEGDSIIYWPSFEIVRWCGGHLAQVFGNDDGSPFHVSHEVVDTIIDSFIRTFGTSELCARMGQAAQVTA